ncbi:MAG: hypothetical protein R6U98_12095, partial [Pirellulaceae bacterium]
HKGAVNDAVDEFTAVKTADPVLTYAPMMGSEALTNASGPLLTTVTDMCGLFFVLSFTLVLLQKLSA